jgi:AcrR family transcriptional regulator
VADIVWRAGVSRKTFYELFGSKDDCFAATYDHWASWLFDDMLTAFDTQAEWANRLRAALAILLGNLAREPAAARLCFVEAIVAGGEVVQRRDRAMRRLAVLFLQAPGAPAGALGDTISTGRVSELSETLRREIQDGRAEQLPTLAPSLMYAMVLPFLGAEAAQRELDRGQGELR